MMWLKYGKTIIDHPFANDMYLFEGDDCGTLPDFQPSDSSGNSHPRHGFLGHLRAIPKKSSYPSIYGPEGLPSENKTWYPLVHVDKNLLSKDTWWIIPLSK